MPLFLELTGFELRCQWTDIQHLVLSVSIFLLRFLIVIEHYNVDKIKYKNRTASIGSVRIVTTIAYRTNEGVQPWTHKKSLVGMRNNINVGIRKESHVAEHMQLYY